MKNFEVYKNVMTAQGVETSHKASRVPTIRDFLTDGDILTIPQNVTFFTQGNVEFVVFPNQEGLLKRVYIGWLDRSEGTFRDTLEKYSTYESFFTDKEGRKFKVTISEDGNTFKDPFGVERPVRSYNFDWCD